MTCDVQREKQHLRTLLQTYFKTLCHKFGADSFFYNHKISAGPHHASSSLQPQYCCISSGSLNQWLTTRNYNPLNPLNTWVESRAHYLSFGPREGSSIHTRRAELLASRKDAQNDWHSSVVAQWETQKCFEHCLEKKLNFHWKDGQGKPSEAADTEMADTSSVAIDCGEHWAKLSKVK